MVSDKVFGQVWSMSTANPSESVGRCQSVGLYRSAAECGMVRMPAGRTERRGRGTSSNHTLITDGLARVG